MPRIVQIIGNGDSAAFYNEAPKRKGLKLTCNLAPFEVEGVYATCIVDFKMMNTIHKGEIEVPGEWICGARPKEYCNRNPKFHLPDTKIGNKTAAEVYKATMIKRDKYKENGYNLVEIWEHEWDELKKSL